MAYEDYDDDGVAQGPGVVRTLIGGTLVGGAAAFGCALIWWGIRAATGFDFAIVAIIAGAIIGGATLMGSGRGGLLPAFISVVHVYLCVSGSLAMQIFSEFAADGDIVGAIIVVPFTIVGLIPVMVMSGDCVALVFMGLAMFAAVRICVMDGGSSRYAEY